jgi:hypothetical protein
MDVHHLVELRLAGFGVGCMHAGAGVVDEELELLALPDLTQAGA